MDKEVLVEHDAGLVIITINRPDQRNAVNRAVSYGVCEAIDEFERDPELRVAILTGAGGNFCSGMDLKAFLRGEVTRVEGRGILGIARTPPTKPLIAAVEGYAMEMALTGDTVPAERLYPYGLFNALVEPGQALEQAKQLARRIIANAPMSVAASKRVVVEQRDWPTAEMFDRQEPITGPVLKSQDAREGAAAFAERRTPQWKGV
jgi:enoyl-CoA hydratase